MRPLRLAVLAAALAGALPVSAQAFDAPRGVAVVETEKGEVLAEDGMTLYVYDRDRPFESTCTGACAANWTPLKAREDAARVGRFLAIERPDGSWQWSYGGRPLYRWSKDRRKGDATGDGLAGAWHAARP